jgi:cell volume regulation protein A
MTSIVIISLCVLVLVAYLFDITSVFTKIPSVILLLALGWGVKRIVVYYNYYTPDLSKILPLLGTIGLILIVLEGSLELELNKSKIPLIKKSLAASFFPMMILAFAGAFIITMLYDCSYRVALANLIPLCIISSSLAIPSAKQFPAFDKEFITYESSMSDILGLVFFNFIIANEIISAASFGIFLLQILIIIVVSFLATALLSFLLSRISHDIKFVPIILLVILIYEISKIYNLPSLVFILIFGLFLGNLDEIKHIKWIQKLKPYSLNKEAQKFLGFTMEITFLIKALFFLLFGFLIKTSDLLDTNSIAVSAIITGSIFLIRIIQLKASKLPLAPLLFVAPRGLINILLFLSIPAALSIPVINSSVLIQVIILTALIMMIGTVSSAKKVKEEKQNDETLSIATEL